MPNKIKPKRSYTTNSVPRAEDLEPHEIAINWSDGKLFTKNASGQVVTMSAGGSVSGGGYSAPQSISAVTANYTIATSDAGKLITVGSTNAVSVTVPANAADGIAVGTHIDIARVGSGAVSVAASSGVTVNSTPGPNLRAQYSAGTLIKVGTDSWLLVGDISA